MIHSNNIDFLEQHITFLERQQHFSQLLELLNPETVLCRLNLKPTRLITWYELDKDAKVLGPFYRRNHYPYSPITEDIVHIIQSSTNSDLLSHYVSKIRWFSTSKTYRNSLVPINVPKNLESGVCLELTENGFEVFFQNVNQGSWFTYQENPTRVIPITSSNLEILLQFFSDHSWST